MRRRRSGSSWRMGIELLTARRRESPKDVQLGINRGGELTYVKLSDTARTA